VTLVDYDSLYPAGEISMKPADVFAVVIRTVGLIVSLIASVMLSFALLTLTLALGVRQTLAG